MILSAMAAFSCFVFFYINQFEATFCLIIQKGQQDLKLSYDTQKSW